MRAWWTSLMLLAGCTVHPSQLATADHAVPGAYSGTMFLQLRAGLGPVPLVRDSCEADLELWVDPGADHLVEGIARCEMESTGRVKVELWADEVAMPEVGGEFESEALDASWQGWFLVPDHLYGEAKGKQPHQGLTLRYEATFDALWDMDLGTL